MRRELLILLAIIILMGCGKKGADTPVNTPTAPTAAILSFPAQSAVCTTGAIISDTISTIIFTWSAASNAESYDLYLKNLLTSVTTTQSTGQPQLSVNLARNTPFSWYVISKSSKTSATAQSDTWKFYNAGKGTVYYAPFPADLTSPTFGQVVTTTTINLTWKGSSVLNGTIANYDVYFGTSTIPYLLKSGVTDSFLSNVNVTTKSTYYWKIITRDILGNTSDSGVFQFSVN
jgi:hypothetical protein